MKIALDFDGVLSHTMKRWVAIFNEQYSHEYNYKKLTIRDINEWAFFEQWGMPASKAFEIFDQAWGNPIRLEPLEQDLWQKTKMLNNLGLVDIVTSVTQENLKYVAEWLQNNDVRYNQLLHSNVKHELDYDIFIDDSPRNLEGIYNAGKIAIIYNQPWNRDLDDENMMSSTGGRWYRAYNLYHAIDIIRKLRKFNVVK